MSSDEVLRNARFTSSSASSSSAYPDAPTASSIFNASIDPSALHPLAGLVDNKDLDYLLLEDDKISATAGGKSVLPSRGWGDELCYGTGTTYLAGEQHPLVSPRSPLVGLFRDFDFFPFGFGSHRMADELTRRA